MTDLLVENFFFWLLNVKYDEGVICVLARYYICFFFIIIKKKKKSRINEHFDFFFNYIYKASNLFKRLVD